MQQFPVLSGVLVVLEDCRCAGDVACWPLIDGSLVAIVIKLVWLFYTCSDAANCIVETKISLVPCSKFNLTVSTK